jgi:hypothetical protein
MNRRTAARAALAISVLLLNCERSKNILSSGRFIEKRPVRIGRMRFAYDPAGNLSRIDTCRVSVTDSTYTPGSPVVYEFIYENGYRIREDVHATAPYGGIGDYGYLYEYDSNGLITRVRGLNRNLDGSYNESVFQWLAEYDSLERPVAMNWLHSDGSTSPYCQLNWDENGNIREQRTDFSSGVAQTVITYEYDRAVNPCSVLKGVMDAFYAYNRNNPVKFAQISTICPSADDAYEYDYDESGYPVSRYTVVNGIRKGELKFEYEPVPSKTDF